MGDFLTELAAKRRKYLDGVDANTGDINLDIFEDFYPDEAHFVFELLQNAEDTGATEVSFSLMPDGCWFQHNGKRPFTDDDVSAITGINNSKKTGASDKIGKFGVGFKSVFVYTKTPTIYSKNFSFQITRYVMPEPVDSDPMLGNHTKFWFPFDNPKRPQPTAYSEIAQSLCDLAETTLLFLPNIKSIKWKLGSKVSGEILRDEHSLYHIEVLKDVTGQDITSSHFLRFSQPVKGLENQSVSIAFALAPLQTEAALFEKASLAERFKIVPVVGQVAVYFPAKKETSNLRFHLHAPFIPELSRASIKATKENQPLFNQLAKLSASALYHIRDLGLLTAEFLGVLPNPQDALVMGSGYAAIRDAIVDEIKNEPLCPTFDKKHAPAKRLLQAGGNLKELLNEDDLEFLVDYDDEPPLWAANRLFQAPNVDRFMSGLGIRTWDTAQFHAELSKHLSPYNSLGREAIFTRWLNSKDIIWHQRFYGLFNADSDPSRERYVLFLPTCKLVKLQDGSYAQGNNCHFVEENDTEISGLNYANSDLYARGSSETLKSNARKGLLALGVKPVEKADRTRAYLEENCRIDDDESEFNEQHHVEELKHFMALGAAEFALLANYKILFGSDGRRHLAQNLTICEALPEYFGLSKQANTVFQLADFYRNYETTIGTIQAIATKFALPKLIPIISRSVVANPEAVYLQNTPGVPRSTWKQADYHIEDVSALAVKQSVELSKLLWETFDALTPLHFISDNPDRMNNLRAMYQNNTRYGARFADSLMVCHAREAAWVPQTDGRFVKPADASAELLPSGFNFNAQRPWIKAVNFGEDLKTLRASQSPDALKQAQDEAAKTLGLDRDTAIQLGEVPKEELRDFLANRKPRLPIQLPERKSNNPARRQLKVCEAALNAPERQTEGRMRSVSVGAAEVKSEAREYLRSHYTNNDGLQVCQICQDELPFKKANGEYYFECIEVFDKSETFRHHDANYLCLCPNHAAMFEHANPAKAEFQRSMVEERETKIPINLADMDFRVYFTEDHLSDIRAVMGVESEVG